MIQEFVDKWMDDKKVAEKKFKEKHPENYEDIVRTVLEVINPDSGYDKPDPKRIHVIDDGHYQGTLLFVIPDVGYQPDDYWYVFVDYGSCSGCDTLQAISGYTGDPPTEEQVAQYMTLCLHVVQKLKKMDNSYVPLDI